MYFFKVFILLIFLSSLLPSQELKKVSIQLQWLHQFQFAGYYIAKEKGFYKELGLDVEIREYNKNIDVVEEVIKNKSTFGTGRSSLLLDFYQKKPVVALASIFQSSPTILMTTNPTIKNLQDFKDKTIMMTKDQVHAATVISMLMSKGIYTDHYKRIDHSFKLEDLIDLKTDGMLCYTSNEPYTLDYKKIPYKIFNPKDYGFDFYDDILFTSQDMIDNDPQTVRAFYEASMKGWIWAFENIEDASRIIFKNYNTQLKSLKHLIYEGKELYKLAYQNAPNFGNINLKKMSKIAQTYNILGLIETIPDMTSFVDPLSFHKKKFRLGVLTNINETVSLKKWDHLISYLESELYFYDFDLVPLSFEMIEPYVKEKKIDFLITNPSLYILMKQKFSINRIATLKNRFPQSDQSYSKYGSVVFTKKNSKIDSISQISGKKVAAVNKKSFGGWIIALDLFNEFNIKPSDFIEQFFMNHENVVMSVLENNNDVGIVRTDVLERMDKEGIIDINELKIINSQKYDGFDFLVSSKLYPEWPFLSLSHIADDISSEVLSTLLQMKYDRLHPLYYSSIEWTIPIDYSPVIDIMKQLKIEPFEYETLTLSEFIEKYKIELNFLVILFIIVTSWFINEVRLNKKLNSEVKKRTNELELANKKLQNIAHIDVLTNIYNRRYFMQLAQKYFHLAKRNNTPFQFLMIDIDYFKHINDNYGHQVGDKVLKIFASNLATLVRKTD
ncbi:MAG TPA: diguanylate cyclase, partial [Arcobacter sp.]|nr:diguanylate cyclase [Arcobacter sp.]